MFYFLAVVALLALLYWALEAYPREGERLWPATDEELRDRVLPHDRPVRPTYDAPSLTKLRLPAAETVAVQPRAHDKTIVLAPRPPRRPLGVPPE